MSAATGASAVKNVPSIIGGASSANGSSIIAEASLPRLQEYIRDVGVDGWLLFDFRGSNAIMGAVVGSAVFGTRRSFAYFPASGVPTALVHGIDAELWRDWPAAWNKHIWVTRDELQHEVTKLVQSKRVAVEYSPNGAIPYLDTLPAGMAEFLRAAGATLVSSGELVTRYCSVWTEENLRSHVRAAEIVATIAREAFAIAGERARGRNPMTEYELTRWICTAFDRSGLRTASDPSVSFGPNAARNHYVATEGESAAIVTGNLLLIDLWAVEPGGIYADQTWMGSIGTPTQRQQHLWNVVRDARDASLDLLRERIRTGTPVTGAEADRAAKSVIEQHGYTGHVMSRTGHSIDRFGMHGLGPAIDDTETFDNRLLIPGVGFSVEPGIYFPNEVGIRSEVDAVVQDDDLLVTPREYQHDLIIA